MSSKYNLKFSGSAMKTLKRMDKQTATRIINALEMLAGDPYKHPNTKHMKGYEGEFFRLRVGQFRVIYELINEELYISVVRIGARGDVYK